MTKPPNIADLTAQAHAARSGGDPLPLNPVITGEPVVECSSCGEPLFATDAVDGLCEYCWSRRGNDERPLLRRILDWFRV